MLKLPANVTKDGRWHFDIAASLAELAEHPLSKREVVGSNPTGGFRLERAVLDAGWRFNLLPRASLTRAPHTPASLSVTISDSCSVACPARICVSLFFFVSLCLSLPMFPLLLSRPVVPLRFPDAVPP